MKETTSLIEIITKDFDIPEKLSEEQIRAQMVGAFGYLVDNDFPKLIQILYKADVDQYKLKQLLENAEGKTTAEVIADAYIERQKAKLETRKTYSS